MTTLADVAGMLRDARLASALTQTELARRAGVDRSTLARMEGLARGDMTVSILLRLLDSAGYDFVAVKRGHQRTLEHVLQEPLHADVTDPPGTDPEAKSEAHLDARPPYEDSSEK